MLQGSSPPAAGPAPAPPPSCSSASTPPAGPPVGAATPPVAGPVPVRRAPSLRDIHAAGTAYVAMPSGPARAAAASTWKRKAIIGGVVLYGVVLFIGALMSVAIVAHLLPMLHDVRVVIHKVNNIYEPLVGATDKISTMYTWIQAVLEVVCDMSGVVPPVLRPLICNSPNGTAAVDAGPTLGQALDGATAWGAAAAQAVCAVPGLVHARLAPLVCAAANVTLPAA
jgi:hypothetical protein